MKFFDMVPSLIQSGVDLFTNNQNLDFQKDTLNWQKSVQKNTWAREDNAVQRRANDLRAAGLSQTLAAGGGAQTSAPIQVTTPHSDFNGRSVQGAMETYLMGVQAKARNTEIERTEAEKARLLEESKKIASEKAGQDLMNENYAISNRYLEDYLRNRNALQSGNLANLNIQNEYLSKQLQANYEYTKAQIEKIGIDNALTKANTDLSKQNLNIAKIDEAIKKLTKTYMESTQETDINLKQVELQLKLTLLNSETLSNEIKKYDYDLFRILGLPTNTTFNQLERFGLMFGNSQKTMLQNFFDRERSKVK